MDFKIIISPSALQDLKDVFDFISVDSVQAATDYCSGLPSTAELLPDSPRMGRPSPEFNDENIRDLVLRNNRFVCHLDSEQGPIEIARFWHGARGYLSDELDQQRQFPFRATTKELNISFLRGVALRRVSMGPKTYRSLQSTRSMSHPARLRKKVISKGLVATMASSSG